MKISTLFLFSLLFLSGHIFSMEIQIQANDIKQKVASVLYNVLSEKIDSPIVTREKMQKFAEKICNTESTWLKQQIVNKSKDGTLNFSDIVTYIVLVD